MESLKTLNPYFYKYRWRFALGILFVLLSNWFKVLQPQAIREALDLLYEKVKTGQTDDISGLLFLFGVKVLGFAVLMGVFMYFMRDMFIVMSRLIERDLRQSIFTQYTKLHTGFYKQHHTGDFMSRITEDVNKVRMYLGPGVMYAVNLIGSFVVVVAAMVQQSWILTICSLAPLPILSIGIYKISRVINQRSERVQKQLAVLTSNAQETFSGIRVVKSYVQEDMLLGNFEKESERYRSMAVHLAKAEAMFYPMMLLLIGLSTILTVWVGGVLVSKGMATPGNIAEFVIYINMLTWPFTAIGWIASITQTAEASQKRINEFLSAQPEIISGSLDLPKTCRVGDKVLEFDNVSMVYPESGVEALYEVSFSIKAGERVAIVGKTGSGKSSIAELMLRLYDPTKGQIKYMGKDMRSVDLSALRASFAYVPQDVFLFSESVSNNINYPKVLDGNENAAKWAEIAAIDQEVEGLRDGYSTVVGERGVMLSGGQKQRISIARALSKTPEVLLFDDCLSAVDAATEYKIAQSLQGLFADKTVVIITHRIYPSIQFDKVLVMESGRVAAFGTHEEVLAQNEYFRGLNS